MDIYNTDNLLFFHFRAKPKPRLKNLDVNGICDLLDEAHDHYDRYNSYSNYNYYYYYLFLSVTVTTRG